MCVCIYNIKNCMKKIKSTKQKEDIKKIWIKKISIMKKNINKKNIWIYIIKIWRNVKNIKEV